MLEAYFSQSQIDPDQIDGSITHIERQALDASQLWISGPRSDLLYIRWPAVLMNAAPGTSFSTRLVHMLSDANIPVLSYFFSDVHSINGEGDGDVERALVAMIYALIWQLSNLLPRTIVDHAPYMTVENFANLDGTVWSLNIALDLLATLLVQTRQPVLFCIIDGLHCFDMLDASVDIRQALEALIALLSVHVERLSNLERTFKLLFTSSGFSELLMEGVNPEKIAWLDQGPKGKRPGRRSRGRGPMTQLMLV